MRRSEVIVKIMPAKLKLNRLIARTMVIGCGLLLGGLNLAQLLAERRFHPVETDKTLSVVPALLLVCLLSVGALQVFRSRMVPIIVACGILHVLIPWAVTFGRHVMTDRILGTMGIGFFIVVLGTMPELSQNHSQSNA